MNLKGPHILCFVPCLAGMGEKPKSAVRPVWETLTTQERHVLKLIAEGYPNKEIAALLSFTVKTVETHRGKLMRKLDLHSVAALTALALEKA